MILEETDDLTDDLGKTDDLTNNLGKKKEKGSRYQNQCNEQ